MILSSIAICNDNNTKSDHTSLTYLKASCASAFFLYNGHKCIEKAHLLHRLRQKTGVVGLSLVGTYSGFIGIAIIASVYNDNYKKPE